MKKMGNTSTYLLSCPCCGVLKRVAFSNVNLNSVNHVVCSNGRVESNEWSESALTRQCPSCKNFFTILPLYLSQVEDTTREGYGAVLSTHIK